MKQKILGILALCLALTFSSQAQVVKKVKRKSVTVIPVKKNSTKYSLKELRGKWQEVRRTTRSNAELDFKDTLCYFFTGNDEVYSRDGINMSLKGGAILEPDNTLVAAADVFTIRSLTTKQLVLDDNEKYIHTLMRKDNFWYESLPSRTIVPETFSTPIRVDLSAIVGKWMVFRRDAKPGAIADNDPLIRILSVMGNNTGNNNNGEITYYLSDRSVTHPARIMVEGDRIRINSNGLAWDMLIYKASDRELVFGNRALMYFCKPL